MDGIFNAGTFTVPRFHRWDQIRPKPGLVVGLVHDGTNVGVFAMQDYDRNSSYELKVYIPIDTDFRGWGGNWWPLSSIVHSFPDSEIARHFEDISIHPENYRWIYPNLEPYIDEDWFKELLDATPDLKEDAHAANS